ncbi:hypothetical protein D3C73_1376880 [compost metagenome]
MPAAAVALNSITAVLPAASACFALSVRLVTAAAEANAVLDPVASSVTGFTVIETTTELPFVVTAGFPLSVGAVVPVFPPEPLPDDEFEPPPPEPFPPLLPPPLLPPPPGAGA